MRTRLISLSWRLNRRKESYGNNSSLHQPWSKDLPFRWEVCLNWLDRTSHVSHSQWLRPAFDSGKTHWLVGSCGDRGSKTPAWYHFDIYSSGSMDLIAWIIVEAQAGDYIRLMDMTWLTFIASTRGLSDSFNQWRFWTHSYGAVGFRSSILIGFDVLSRIKPLFKMDQRSHSPGLKIMLWIFILGLIRFHCPSMKAISRYASKSYDLAKASWPVKSRQLGNSCPRRYAHDILMWLLQSNQ